RLCFVFSGMAQTSASSCSIHGKILDEKKLPIEYGTIMLLSAKDSALVKGDFSDATGSFGFDHLATGNYVVSITNLGYKKFVSNTIEVTDSRALVDLGTISLEHESKEVSEVTVSALKPAIQHENDKLILNIEGSAIAAG